MAQAEENLVCLNFKLTSAQIERLNERSRIQLGFPHDFISEAAKLFLYRNTYSLIDNHKVLKGFTLSPSKNNQTYEPNRFKMASSSISIRRPHSISECVKMDELGLWCRPVKHTLNTRNRRNIY